MTPLVALLLHLAPAPAPIPAAVPDPITAPDPPDPQSTDSNSNPKLLKAQQLYRDGAAHYDLFDYNAAISLWIEAAALISDEWRRARMIYNIAEAHLKAYAQDRDPAHLRAARDLYTRFLTDVQRLDHGKETLSTDVANATITIEKVSNQITTLERQAEADRELIKIIADNTLRPELSPRTRALRGVGIAFTATGVAAFGLMAAGLVLGRQLEDQASLTSLNESERIVTLARGERANYLAISGAVLGASFLAIGVPTLSLGLVRARRERTDAHLRLRPVVGPGRAMLFWEGRF